MSQNTTAMQRGGMLAKHRPAVQQEPGNGDMPARLRKRPQIRAH